MLLNISYLCKQTRDKTNKQYPHKHTLIMKQTITTIASSIGILHVVLLLAAVSQHIEASSYRSYYSKGGKGKGRGMMSSYSYDDSSYDSYDDYYYGKGSSNYYSFKGGSYSYTYGGKGGYNHKEVVYYPTPTPKPSKWL
jgi:hypothetical protein